MSESDNNTDQISLLIVDDHSVVRDGLRAMLMRSNIDIVGEATDGLSAVEQARQLNPDVILMDEPLGALDALTREKMQSLVLELWKETGKTILIITHSVEEALLLGERLFVMAPRPGRIHKEYQLPFAERGLTESLREVKKDPHFSDVREEILTMIWDMEEEIMGRV